jgi:UDP-N-acetylglucosamine 2-epimerase
VHAPPEAHLLRSGERLVLVTAHRRESFESGLAEICGALRTLVAETSDIVVVFPVHPNPNVKGQIEQLLGGIDRIHLCAPIDYGSFVWLLNQAFMVLTDSGGIQEEASALGKPMLVLRAVTERPEALSMGNALLVGAQKEAILEHSRALLTDGALHKRMATASSAFGDGRAAEQIMSSLRGMKL